VIDWSGLRLGTVRFVTGGERGVTGAYAGAPEAASHTGARPGTEAAGARRGTQATVARVRRKEAASQRSLRAPGPRRPPEAAEGFHEYVSSRTPALLRTAYLLTGNTADAEDLVQSALAKTYLAWNRIEDQAALDGYVRRAMVNTHISWWRRRRLEEYPTDVMPDQAVADPAITSDLQESLRRAIDRLPERMRAAVVLRYLEDMTEPEVAEVLGVSLGTVKSTVSRAVAKLREDADLQ
jgi:RNA polymerase sigma-70 factor (sigma-E family)